MRLTYLYVRHKRYEFEKLRTDGHFALMQELVKRGIVEQARIILDNYGTTVSRQVWNQDGVEVLSLQGLDAVELEENEVVWVRGGWKAWIKWIERHAPRHWFLYYGANAGHHAWKWWDVLLEDRREQWTFPGRTGRLVWYYRKPISPDFKPQLGLEQDWGVCVGASHQYDRKGQYRILAIADEFKRLTGRVLCCVMPGCFYSHERRTEEMRELLRTGAYPNIHLPGMLPRKMLANVFNRSTFMYAAMCGGQGDRGALEAAACGCRMIFSRREVHAPYLTADPRFAFVPSHPDATDEIAAYLARELDASGPTRAECADYAEQHGGMEACIAALWPVLNMMREHVKSDGREQLGKLLLEPW